MAVQLQQKEFYNIDLRGPGLRRTSKWDLSFTTCWRMEEAKVVRCKLITTYLAVEQLVKRTRPAFEILSSNPVRYLPLFLEYKVIDRVRLAQFVIKVVLNASWVSRQWSVCFFSPTPTLMAFTGVTKAHGTATHRSVVSYLWKKR